MKNIKLGKYKHYRGDIYEVIGIAKNADTKEEFVVYRGLYDSKEFGKNPLWIRTLEKFLEPSMVNNKKVERFKYIEK